MNRKEKKDPPSQFDNCFGEARKEVKKKMTDDRNKGQGVDTPQKDNPNPSDEEGKGGMREEDVMEEETTGDTTSTKDENTGTTDESILDEES